ncbi:hypothetical protein H072_5598 [Dactylellina haptotyla CBS 200.50]|uniref:Endoplasmic reticulum transmembrane protein n=1 Tax=Dactylellina haptotyla (strain CBS 200.50) TaxID=1284197 RepID=S8BYT6_DACHA|nr:hypothetical protein H072_5598 [Dactylellina haptotyla CBS 200.50]
MTLYYSLVFALLMFEMGIFLVLILPLPLTWRRQMFTFISTNPLIAKLQYGLKITFIFILILFIDSVNRVYRVQRELSDAAQAATGNRGGAAAILGHERTEVQARKFYSQRNMYLCGFTLFLSLILNRTYVLILDILRLEEEVKLGRSSGNKGIKDYEALKEELRKKDIDLQAMKEQTKGLGRAYDDLSDQVKVESTPKKTK